MTPVQEQLVSILAGQLFSAGCPAAEAADGLLDEAREQAVFPLVFHGLAERGREREGSTAYAAYQAAFIRNLHSHAELHCLLSEESIPYVILKGQASASYYPDPMLRVMGDVDFLVPVSEREKADALLRDRGFDRPTGAEKHAFHWAYTKGRIRLELHWDLPGMPASDGRIRTIASDIIEKAVPRELMGRRMMLPSPFHHGIVLLLHTISHLTGGGIGLRHLCDWLVFQESLPEEEFRALFEGPLREIGLWKFAQVLTRVGILYFGCGERSWCRDADEKVCRALLEDILAGGNFGVKDDARKSQEKLIQDRATKRLGQGWLKTGFANLNEKAMRDYPFSRRLLLRPIGLTAVTCRYAAQVVGGKRNNVFSRKIMNTAMERKKLYGELKLFESES